VALLARDREGLERCAESVARAGGEALVLPVDVTDREALLAAVEEAAGGLGGLDVAVVNAGVTQTGLFEEMRPETIERLLAVNLLGAAWTARAALPHLLDAAGRLVLMASLTGLVAIPGRSVYSAAKFGMRGLADALRGELHGRGVSVTLVCPGFVDTPISRNALRPDGRPQGEKERRMIGGAMGVEACARATLRAADRRRRRLVLTPMARLLTALDRVAPRLAAAVVRRATV
jgi:short-subunit dehydrogenase